MADNTNSTTGHENEVIDVKGLKASLQKLKTDHIDKKANTNSLGTAAAKNVPASGNAGDTEVVMGNDTRLSDNRKASDVFEWAKAENKPTYTASEVGAIPTGEKGAANGVASLDDSGKVPQSQLPSYVDDVLEYDNRASFPETGESGKIYVNKAENTSWRWSGSTYVQIKGDLALGETSSTAYRGDRGKTAYYHSQVTSGNPHNVSKSDVGLGNVGNFKAVSTKASQGLSSTEQSNARANIGLDNLSRLGCGYGTCYTDATTAAKTVSISHFLLLVNGIVSVRFTKAISVDNATLNVSGSGAKPILINGEALQKGLIKAGMTATLQYDGTNWNIISMMGLEQSTTPSDLYVDMGLPSGTLWAKANIDVTTQSGFAEVDGKPSPFKYECSFFSWGNVDGHNHISASAFDYDFGSSNDGPYAQTPGAQLTADAGLSFDAARANLGSPWRDPSTDDFVELFDNIDYVQADGETVIDASQANKLVTVNNITGIYLKSKINGNLLFFPCSGYGFGQSWYSRGSSGYYWSRSLNSQADCRHLVFYSGGVLPQSNDGRFHGFSRRAVQ